MRLFFSLILLVGCCLLVSAEARQPNVVIIFIDDQGYYDLGCYGATEIKTPRIDQLAEEGIRFTGYYAAAPICSPSRAGLLTGAYPRRIGMETWVQRADSTRGIHPDEVTLAELFKESGYATACIGKWHMGDKEPFVPNAQGFDYHLGMYSNLDPVETVYFGDKGVPILRNGEVVKRPADPAELTKLYTDEAIAFIERKKDEPFFLYLPHTMLHKPLGVSPEFQGSSDWGEYGDAIQELDHHVGRFMDKLTDLELDQNTVVVYASDNGRGAGRNPEQPLKGTKLTTWEAGIRVPGILWGPGLGVLSGIENDEIVTAMDWFPTLATAAGVKIADDHPVIDGRDLWPLMTGKTDGIPSPSAELSLNAGIPLQRRWEQGLEWSAYFDREDYLNAFFYHGSHGALAAVRSGRHKMYLNPQLTIYDLEADPGESEPVRERDLIKKLRGMAVMFQEEMSRDARQAGESNEH
ncbi:MAG: sulfatase [Verrucomicrobiota bacterium]